MDPISDPNQPQNEGQQQTPTAVVEGGTPAITETVVNATAPTVAKIEEQQQTPTPDVVARHLARHRELHEQMQAEARAALDGLKAQRQAIADEAQRLADEYAQRIGDMDGQINALASDLGIAHPATVARPPRQPSEKLKERQERVLAYLSAPERKGQWCEPETIRRAAMIMADPNNNVIRSLVDSGLVESNYGHGIQRRYRAK